MNTTVNAELKINVSMTVATGILKGYDQLLNLVLDGTIEHMQGRCTFSKFVATVRCLIQYNA